MQRTTIRFLRSSARAGLLLALTGAGLAATPGAGSAQTGAAASARPAGAGPTPSGMPRLTRATASEIEAIIEGNRFERETAGYLIRLLLDYEGGVFAGYKKGGGWCWNDDGTFHGPLPCPRTVAGNAGARRTTVNDCPPTCPENCPPTCPGNVAGNAGGAQRAAQQQVGPAPRPSRAAATEIVAFLERSTMSRDAVIGLILLFQLKDQPGLPSGYKKGGGWCWNDDWTFYGPLPCPTVKE